jgi:hypothetical protein
MVDSPYVTSIGYDMYGTPILGVYKNLNADPYVRSRMVDLFYHKTAEKWLEGDLSDVLNYFKVVDGKTRLIKSFDEYNPVTFDKDSQSHREHKIDYIKDHFLTKEFVKKVLKEYVKDNDKNWYDLTKASNDMNVRNAIKDALIRRIKESIKKHD